MVKAPAPPSASGSGAEEQAGLANWTKWQGSKPGGLRRTYSKGITEDGESLTVEASRPGKPAPSAPQSVAPPPSPGPNVFYIKTVVADPVVEFDGQHKFMAYLIETSTNNPAFLKLQFSTRRRYSDFEFLFHCLVSDFPTSLVPPLPGKHNFQYLKGETTRLGESFTAKRCHSLNKFMMRILTHPVLSQSGVLTVFLEGTEWVTYKKNLTIVAVGDDSASQSAVDTLTETLMNAFKRSEETNTEILLIHEKLNKLNDNLGKIEKIFGKVALKHELLAQGYRAFHKNLAKMSEAGIEENLTMEFEVFNEGIQAYSECLGSYGRYLEQAFIIDLKDLVALIVNFKKLLKTKQDRKLDLDLLVGYLTDYKYERNKLITLSAVSQSAMGAIRNKLEDLKGVNHEQARVARISKLEERVARLEAEIALQEKLLAEFEQNLLKEWEYFEATKGRELKASLLALCDFNIQFYKGAIDNFRSVEETLSAKLTAPESLTPVPPQKD